MNYKILSIVLIGTSLSLVSCGSEKTDKKEVLQPGTVSYPRGEVHQI